MSISKSENFIFLELTSDPQDTQQFLHHIVSTADICLHQISQLLMLNMDCSLQLYECVCGSLPP